MVGWIQPVPSFSILSDAERRKISIQGENIGFNKAQIQQIETIVASALSKHLDSSKVDVAGMPKGDNDMPKKIRRPIMIDGVKCWICGDNEQEYAENAAKLFQRQSDIPAEKTETKEILLKDYLRGFVDTYKSRQQELTMRNREQIIRKHINPRIGELKLTEITTAMFQRWFDELASAGYKKETVLKIKNTLNPALDSAVEDGLIARNPLRSKRIVIHAEDGENHKAIPPKKMKQVRDGLAALPEISKLLAALLSYEGLRLEEVLGLQWQDVDFENKLLHVRRAVVHPSRNQPIVKIPKTKSSVRTVPLAEPLAELLTAGTPDEFIIGGKQPISYQQYKRAFRKIQNAFDLSGYTAHDFRDTCATEWHEHGMPMDGIAKMLGHASSAVTEKHYVKFRGAGMNDAKKIMDAV